MPERRVILIVIASVSGFVAGLIVVAGLPIITVSKTETAFEIRNLDVESGSFTWRDFDVPSERTIVINFVCHEAITAYLFTEHQFTNFKNVGDEICIDSIKQVQLGYFRFDVETSGTFYFVMFNIGESRVRISSVTGKITFPIKITLLQSKTGNW